jgi:hypothetical protein
MSMADILLNKDFVTILIFLFFSILSASEIKVLGGWKGTAGSIYGIYGVGSDLGPVKGADDQIYICTKNQDLAHFYEAGVRRSNLRRYNQYGQHPKISCSCECNNHPFHSGASYIKLTAKSIFILLVRRE